MRNLSKVVNAILNAIPDGKSPMLKTQLIYQLMVIRYTAPELMNKKWEDVQKVLMEELFCQYGSFIFKLGSNWEEKVRKIWAGEIDLEKEEEEDDEMQIFQSTDDTDC